MLPIMTEALGGLTKQMQFAILKKTQQNYDTVETIKAVDYFQASSQPLTPRQLAIKPEGQRRWKWLTIFTTKDVPLDNYILELETKNQFRIMSKSDWREAGYFQYEITESSDVGAEAP